MTYTALSMLWDGTVNSYTAKAAAHIQNGWFVSASGADSVVSSGGLGDLVFADIVAIPAYNTITCAGIAGNTAASGAEVTIYTKGIFVVPVGSGTATPGQGARAEGYGSGTTTDLGGMAGDATLGTDGVIGTWLTGGVLAGYAVLKLNL